MPVGPKQARCISSPYVMLIGDEQSHSLYHNPACRDTADPTGVSASVLLPDDVPAKVPHGTELTPRKSGRAVRSGRGSAL